MPLYTKESLERLRQSIDLQEVISSHIDLKRAGATYKALCPFHEEKTPSFVVQKGDSHYHCFGCGAHGDAIQFLMNYLKFSFTEAVESLAEKFNVPLEMLDKAEEKGPNKSLLKEALDCASQFFHAYLLHTIEGQEALRYLYKRGISLDFIKKFELGYAPNKNGLLKKVLHEKRFSDELLFEAGLIGEKKGEFFRERITFPIRSSSGQIIGFSARKIKEETFGGKYINTPETPLFKKSKVLFGLPYCRRRIAKERRAIIVEGQIDCLKMIEAGFTLTVAALGTAFGEGHVKELQQLGVRQVYLLFDGDDAGEIAASKVGNMFQKVGIEVSVAVLPPKQDPDSFLRRFGTTQLIHLLSSSFDYLTFQVNHLSKELKAHTPAGKNELIQALKTQIQAWEEPVMIHESLRKVASLTQVPEELLGITSRRFSSYFKKEALPLTSIDPDRILELDLLRWLILMGEEKPKLVETAQKYLSQELFQVPICRTLFQTYMEASAEGRPRDLLSLFISVHEEEAQKCIDELLQKKINREKAESHFKETIQKILDRKWLQTREEIKREIHSGKYSEEEILELARRFDALRKERPVVI